MNCEHNYLNRQGLLSSTTELICSPLPPQCHLGQWEVLTLTSGAGPNSDTRKKRKPAECSVGASLAVRGDLQPGPGPDIAHTQLISFVAFFQGFFLSICYNPRTWLWCHVWLVRESGQSCFSVLHTPRSVSFTHCIALFENSEHWGKWGRVHVSMHYLS